jgi:predicted HTH transcriptional regulator
LRHTNITKDAVREALLNAIAHKDYAGCVPVQIRVYEDRVIVTSEYVKQYNITDRTTRRDLTELVEKNILIKEGDKNHQGIFSDKCPITKLSIII